MLSGIPLLSKILGGTTLVLAIAAGIFYSLWQGALHREGVLKTWQRDTVAAVAQEAGNPAVTAATASAQIHAMGRSLANALAAVKIQSQAVDHLADMTKMANERADAEARARASAVKRAESLAGQLAEEAKTPYSQADLDAEIRRIQDQIYEAGL